MATKGFIACASRDHWLRQGGLSSGSADICGRSRFASRSAPEKGRMRSSFVNSCGQGCPRAGRRVFPVPLTPGKLERQNKVTQLFARSLAVFVFQFREKAGIKYS